MAKYVQGHDWANHEVHTDDGYILNLFRLLPEGVKHGTGYVAKGEPVLIMHGMGNKSSNWLKHDPEAVDNSLPIRLVNEGYDVWLGNQRGTRIS